MFYTYHATHIGYDQDNDSLTIGFGGEVDSDGFPSLGLLLARSLTEDEDITGINGVYIEWNNQINSCYGCINLATLSRNELKIIFDKQADFFMNVEGDKYLDEEKLTILQITFSLEAPEFQVLKNNLTEIIFLNCDCFTVNSGRS